MEASSIRRFGIVPNRSMVITNELAGFPHAVTKDDIFEGYLVPQGAVIIPNQWSILRDEELYPDSESFLPERWLKPDYPTYQEPLTKHPNLQRFAGFGHGRRICPGLQVTEKSLFLQVSSLYWACNIKREMDINGKEIEVPWYDYTGVAISTPRNFRFKAEERTNGRLKMMEEVSQAAHADEIAMAQVQYASDSLSSQDSKCVR